MIEALFLTCTIDTKERRDVVTADLPGFFLQTPADENEDLVLRLDKHMARALQSIDPDKYGGAINWEKNKPVIYRKANGAIYGTLNAAILAWKNLTTFLTEELGFKVNDYGQEVINGKKMAITATRKKVHEYLGMTINFSDMNKVMFTMYDYIYKLIDKLPGDMKGMSATPASTNTFEINDKSPKLDEGQKELFHHLVAKSLFLSKRARPDLQTVVSFLCTRVQQPTEHDWHKLRRTMKYLQATRHLPLILKHDGTDSVKWHIDGSFAVHHSSFYQTKASSKEFDRDRAHRRQ